MCLPLFHPSLKVSTFVLPPTHPLASSTCLEAGIHRKRKTILHKKQFKSYGNHRASPGPFRNPCQAKRIHPIAIQNPKKICPRNPHTAPTSNPSRAQRRPHVPHAEFFTQIVPLHVFHPNSVCILTSRPHDD